MWMITHYSERLSNWASVEAHVKNCALMALIIIMIFFCMLFCTLLRNQCIAYIKPLQKITLLATVSKKRPQVMVTSVNHKWICKQFQNLSAICYVFDTLPQFYFTISLLYIMFYSSFNYKKTTKTYHGTASWIC